MSIEISTTKELYQRLLPSAEVLFVMPTTDLAMALRCADLMIKRAGAELTLLILQDTDAEGFISLCNRAFKFSSGTFFGYVAQDAFPGRQWLKIALQVMQGCKVNERGLFAFNDGKWQGMLASFGMVSRCWAEQNYNGNLFHSAYHSHYADVELTLHAMDQGVYRYDASSVLIEVDWEKELKSVNQKDRLLYRQRAESGFDRRIANPKLLKLFK